MICFYYIFQHFLKDAAVIMINEKCLEAVDRRPVGTILKTRQQQHKMLRISSAHECQYMSWSPSSSSSFSWLQILELVKGMHYQLACQKYFELTHNVSTDLI